MHGHTVRGALIGAALLAAATLSAGPAHAQGRLLATGGVTQVEGAAGGGLVPWALIAGYGTRDEIGGTAFATYIDTGNFRLRTFGAAVGFYDRVGCRLPSSISTWGRPSRARRSRRTFSASR